MSRPSKTARGDSIVAPLEAFADEYLDVDGWPRQWQVEPRDLVAGQRLLVQLKPFLFHLLDRDLSRKTLRRHRDHLSLLGGEIIRRLHEEPRLRRQPIDTLLNASIEADGGPLIHPKITEAEQRAFDSTCRQLYRFRLGANRLPK
jgi:hypothetical protein